MEKSHRHRETFFETHLFKVWLWRQTHEDATGWYIAYKDSDNVLHVRKNPSDLVHWINECFEQRGETTIENIEEELDILYDFEVDVTMDKNVAYTQLVVDGVPYGDVQVKSALGMVKMYRKYKEDVARRYFAHQCGDEMFKEMDKKRDKLTVCWTTLYDVLKDEPVNRYLIVLQELIMALFTK